MKTIYQNSTNRERIMKSIKLELVPHPDTAVAMEQHGVKEKDDALIEISEKLKPLVTWATKKHIEAALENAVIDFSDLFNIYMSLKNGDVTYTWDDYNKAKEKMSKRLETHMTSYKFHGINAGKVGSSDYFKTFLPELVASTNDLSKDEKEEYLLLLENPTGMSTLMKKFINTRKTAISTWSSERVLENFEIYADNIAAIKLFLDSEYAEEFTKNFPELISIASTQYYEVACLTPDGIEGYNSIISGCYNEKGECTAVGFNELVYKLNSKHNNDNSYEGPFFKKIKKLYQQVLYPRKPLFTIEKLTSDDEVRELLSETFKVVSKKKLLEIIEYIGNADSSQIMIHGNKLGELSHIVYNNYRIIADIVGKEEENPLKDKLCELQKEKKKETNEDKEKQLSKQIKNIKKSLNDVSKYVNEQDYSIKQLELMCDDDRIFSSYINAIREAYTNISKRLTKIMDSNIMTDGNLRGYHKHKIYLKEYADALVEYRRLIRLIINSVAENNKNALFYNKLEELTECLKYSNKAVNLIRNYMTQKPSDIAKEYEICFGTPSRYSSQWWNEDADNGLEQPIDSKIDTVINIDGKYYFCFKGYEQKPFRFEYAADDEEYYEVLNQKTAQKASNVFPKNVFADRARPYFKANPLEKVAVLPVGNGTITVTRELMRVYEEKLFTVDAKKSGLVSEKQFKKNLCDLIDVYKEYTKLNPHFRRFTFDFKDSSEYNDIGEFMDEANTFMLDSSWVKIKKDQIDELIKSGHMYAFLITNRNMYKDENVKTSYAELFLKIMSHENFKTGQIRLNARPQVTFRPACLPYSVTHPTGSFIVNKKTKNGEYIRTDLYKEIYSFVNGTCKQISEEAQKLLDDDLVTYYKTDYDIVRDLRYKVDKYFISISYIKNAKVSDRQYNTITSEVKEKIDKDNNILVISRGVTDLIYYRLYDSKHNLIQEESLNKIGDIDYSKKLKALSDERKYEKADKWNYTNTVQNYKEWYLNVAISRILEVATQYNALIIIESISDSFKDKISCIDNQVFSSFEKKLENRLADYHRKHDTSDNPGSIGNPLQLASTKGGNVNGVLVKINPAYTSSMDKNGFVYLIDASGIHSLQSKFDFIKKLDGIFYNKEHELLEVKINFKNYKCKYSVDHDWTIYVGKPKTVFNRDKKNYEFIKNPINELIDELKKYDLIEGNIAENINDKTLAGKLYDAIISSVKSTVVRKCKDNPFEYVSMPTEIDDSIISVAQNKCDNMAKKFWFISKQENNTDTLNEWLINCAE